MGKRTNTHKTMKDVNPNDVSDWLEKTIKIIGDLMKKGDDKKN